MTDLVSASPAATLNRTRYAGKDFWTLVDDLVTRIQAQFLDEYNDFVTSGVGMMLIDIVSWAGDAVSFYIDRQATESYLETATTRRAVARLARQIGYKMAPAVACAVDLTGTLQQTYAFDVPLPVGMPFKGPNALVYELVESVTFPAGTTGPQTLACREGQTKTETFTGTGAQNQRFRLSPGTGKFVAMTSVVVTVNGEEWTEQEFLTFEQTNQYEVGYNDDPATVRFGNGVAGNVPPAGSEVKVRYVASSGKAGESPLSGEINALLQPLVVAFTSIKMTVTNSMRPSGASDPETLESVKSNAPRFFKTRGVAVTEDDYETLAGRYSDPLAGAVAAAQAYVAHSAADDVELQQLLQAIRNITEPLGSTVTGQLTIIDAALASITTKQLASVLAVGNVSLSLADIETHRLALSALVTTNRQKAVEIGADAASGLAEATALGKDAWLTQIVAAASALVTNTSSMATELTGQETDIDTGDARVTIAGDALSEMVTPLISGITAATAARTAMTTTFVAGVETQLVAIYNHVDEWLSQDGKANLVQVPILTRDVDGFLSQPPAALIRSLQTYLDARKEVTQVVQVIDGSFELLAAVIVGTIGLKAGAVRATVLANVRLAIYGVIKSLRFGEALRLSRLYTVVVPDSQGQGGVAGVSFASLRITGPGGSLTSDGDLVPTTQQAVTLGSLTLGTA